MIETQHKSIEKILHDIKHYLPSQKTLKDFIHHNSLHAFQEQKFYDGIFQASDIFGYKVTLQLHDYRELFQLGRIHERVIDRIIIEQKGSENLKEWVQKLLFTQYDENITSTIGLLRSDWKRVYKIDMDSLVHPFLYRLVSSYLDQGIAMWEFPETKKGFLEDLREMERNNLISMFKNASVKQYFLDDTIKIQDLLHMIVGDEVYFEQYLYDMAFSHRGWGGIVSVIEDEPDSLLIKRKISLDALLHLELCMELDTLQNECGKRWKPLTLTAMNPPIDIISPISKTEYHEVLTLWQDAFEWSYYDQVIGAIVHNAKSEQKEQYEPLFQAVFCIDERECSLRRHIEYISPDCQTYGAPGFFGVEFYFRPMGAKFLDKLCPAPVTPKYVINERDTHIPHLQDIMLSKKTFGLLTGFASTIALGIFSLFKLAQIILKPKMEASISDAFSHVGSHSHLTVEHEHTYDAETGLQIGFTVPEMTDRIENFLRGIGLTNGFSRLVYMMSHGSSSANNPHHGAHDCGACSGRPGCVNARVFCIMANHTGVRSLLKDRGIEIPDTTVFIPCMHDTASDIIEYYDELFTSDDTKNMHVSIKQSFEQALDLNAKERSRRFASINTKRSIESVRRAIKDRSVSLFEPRPELGHGTNSLAIIGRREMTKDLYLDRRAFLNSYDYRTDPNGVYLKNVMAPIGVVCGGINLEYYFSRVDNMKLGCGTKLPHNVMGLLGVANSYDGDLRPGLPWQMIEPHDPVRLLVIVEHYPEIVLNAIQSSDAIYEWYNNEWVHIGALHPETGEFFYFSNGHFHHYHTDPPEIQSLDDVHALFESAPEMMTNHITHATFENLPIYHIQEKP